MYMINNEMSDVSMLLPDSLLWHHYLLQETQSPSMKIPFRKINYNNINKRIIVAEFVSKCGITM